MWRGRLSVCFAALTAAYFSATVAHALDVKRFERSVVRVYVVLKRAGAPIVAGSGTGFVIAPEHIATNNHVATLGNAVDDAMVQVTVRESGTVQDRAAAIVWSSKELDLAVIRVPGMDRPALKLSRASPLDYPPKAAEVWALGFPSVADVIMPSEAERASVTVTRGVVGRIGMGGVSADFPARPVIQHDASINRGSSGGPLLDDCGVVVGINTFLPMTVFDIGLDPSGAFKAYGTPNTGVFASPHIIGLVEAVRDTPLLHQLKIETSARRCRTDERPIAFYVWVGAALAVVALSLVLILHQRPLRRLRRTLASYRGWRRRSGTREEGRDPR